MGGDASAYAALGLEPGADSAAIERAYKRLIKLHHPDRAGRRSARAPPRSTAPIASCGARRGSRTRSNFNDDIGREIAARAWLVAGAGRWSRRVWSRLLAWPVRRSESGQRPRAQPAAWYRGAASAHAAPDPMDQPLNMTAHRRRRRARRCACSRTHDEMALAEAEPRLPPRATRIEPERRAARSLRGLRRCGRPAAGPRSAAGPGPVRRTCGDREAVERRIGAVGRLSGDRRPARRIRLRVELELAPRDPPAAATAARASAGGAA